VGLTEVTTTSLLKSGFRWEAAMGITVREALSIGLLKKARLLAGNRVLSRIIEHVDVIEMPDIRKWVRPNIFFLTSFYAVKDDLGERSVRRYPAQRILEGDLLRLVEAGRWAPSASNRRDGFRRYRRPPAA